MNSMNADRPVVDLSHWNDPVDFDAMRQAGVVGVIHKATEGAGNVDDTYARRTEAALSAGLLWGAYHFLRPGDMAQQAAHFVNTAGDIDLYAADHEDEGVSLDDLKTFLREVEKLTGKKAVIYSGHVLKDQLGNRHDAELAAHPLWLAQYTSGSPSWPDETWPTWWLWQYTDHGNCPGVGGNVDCNRYQGSADDLFQDWTGEEAEPGPQPPAMSEIRITILIEAKGANVTVVTE